MSHASLSIIGWVVGSYILGQATSAQYTVHSREFEIFARGSPRYY